MEEDETNELSPGDWNYDEGSRETSNLEAAITLSSIWFGMFLSFWFIFVRRSPLLGLVVLGLGMVPIVYVEKVGGLSATESTDGNQQYSSHSNSEGNKNTSDDTLSADIRPSYAWPIVISVFIIGGLFYALQSPSPDLIFFALVGGVAALPFWIILTESGAEWAMEISNQSGSSSSSQSVSVGSKKDKSLVCTSCGWQNSQTNNYCNDCGEELAG